MSALRTWPWVPDTKKKRKSERGTKDALLLRPAAIVCVLASRIKSDHEAPLPLISTCNWQRLELQLCRVSSASSLGLNLGLTRPRRP